MDKKIRILIVDDSALMREALRSILDDNPDFEVIGLARNGKEGVEKALSLKPDVITMDLKMPMMTGIDAIRSIMEEIPTPIIVVSSMDTRIVAKALTIGAMDFVAVDQEIEKIAQDLTEKIKISSRIKPLRRIRKKRIDPVVPVPKTTRFKVIALGISTGGPQALQILLSTIPADFPFGFLVVQHIAEGFINGLIEWLQTTTAISLKVAESGDIIKKGTVYFAPDNYLLTVNNQREIILKEDITKQMIYVPSIDEMMKTAAASFGKDTIGVLMTGMGRDGVKGIEAIKKAGGATIAQDEATSTIFGMNKLAIESGAVDTIAPLAGIINEIIKKT